MECYRQVLLEKYGLLHDRIIEIFSLQSKGSNCTLELLDDVAVCTFILENCIEQLDENVNALAEMCVTTRDYTTEAYRINKKKISAVKLKDLK